MSDIESDWEADDELGGRPYGGRPYGGRPSGGRPYGGRPYGGRPYGGKPYGGRPYGGRPYGGKPYGGKPYGGKPYGGKPYGGKLADVGVDFDEWGAEIGEGVCDRSAIIRLGATVVFGTDELQIPAPVAAGAFRAPGAAAPVPAAANPPVPLVPGEWRLEASVAIPIGVVPGVLENPALASTLKDDLAQELALRADEAFLGTSAGGPPGIGARPVFGPAGGGGQRLRRLRDLAAATRAAQTPRNPGWVVHPQALDTLARFLTRNGIVQAAAGRSLDSLALLCPDRADGGTLLGSRFVTSEAAILVANRPRVYYSADWEEAWIGFDPSFVTVAASGGPAGTAPGQLVITASMPLGFALRRPAAFGWAVV